MLDKDSQRELAVETLIEELKKFDDILISDSMRACFNHIYIEMENKQKSHLFSKKYELLKVLEKTWKNEIPDDKEHKVFLALIKMSGIM